LEKSKAEKSPWVKKTKKSGPKNKQKAPYCQGKKKNLAESDKGSSFGQTPSTISASAEDQANVSAGCEQDSSSESGGSDKENETYPRDLISAIRVFLKLSVDSLASCFSAAHFLPLAFLARVLPLPLESSPVILHHRPELNSTEQD